jgi:hypothetical protein
MKYFSIFVVAVLVITCNTKKPAVPKASINCQKIDTIKFFSLINNKWPERKPVSVVDAIKLMDSTADDNFKCAIIKMEETELQFNLGQKIRNVWVRHGDQRFKNQLFLTLNLKNADQSSAFVIELYHQLLIGKINEWIEKDVINKIDISKEGKEELLKIRKDLSSYSKS